MARRRDKLAGVITLPADCLTCLAALADGRTCLGLDREGEGRLAVIISQQETAELARRWPELMDTSFRLYFVPEG